MAPWAKAGEARTLTAHASPVLGTLSPMTPFSTPDYAYCRTLPDGRLLMIEILPNTHIALCLGSPDLVDDLWLYTDLPTALAAAQAWDALGAPQGFLCHPLSGRRGEPWLGPALGQTNAA